MTASDRRGDTRAASPASAAVLGLACACALWSGVLSLFDIPRVRVLGIRITFEDPIRPLLCAAGLALLYAAIWRRRFRTDVEALARIPGRLSWILAGALGVAAMAISLRWGSTVAGGADAYGYVSQALLWRHGPPVVTQEIVNQVPWPGAEWTLAPLGYRAAGPASDRIVPTYAPGYPLLMVLFERVGGECAGFLVVPLCAAATVWLTYLLGMRIFASRAVALGAAALMAVSPVFLYMLMWPMSDVPVAAAWTLALLLATSGYALAAGVVMSVTLAIRPNLLALPASVLLWALLRDVRAWRAGARPQFVLGLTIGVLPAVAGIAWLNGQLYGSPLSSGYGRLAELYSVANLPMNVEQFGLWTLQGQTPAVLFAAVFFAAPVLCAPASVPYARLLLGGTIVSTLASYLFYTPFEAWWFSRFLLPMWPALAIATMAGIDGVLRRWTPRVRPLLAGASVAAIAWQCATFVEEAGVFRLGTGERRYVEMARLVEAHTDPRAVILCLQHSGSLRYYAARTTFRYDTLDPMWLDRALEYFRSTGRRPFIVLEDWEIERFQKRFAGVSAAGRLDWPATAVLEAPTRVSLFDPTPAGRETVLVSLPGDRTTGSGPCVHASDAPVGAR